MTLAALAVTFSTSGGSKGPGSVTEKTKKKEKEITDSLCKSQH